jgi:hypothetical protein
MALPDTWPSSVRPIYYYVLTYYYVLLVELIRAKTFQEVFCARALFCIPPGTINLVLARWHTPFPLHAKHWLTVI